MKSCLMLIKQQKTKPLASSEPDPLASSIVLSPTDRPHLLVSAVKQLLAMDFNAAGHLCSAFLLVYSERHQQNRANGNTLQVREGKMRLQGGGGEDLSPRLITPLMACQVLTQQCSRPLPSSCPSTPPLHQVRKSPAVRHAHRKAIWLATSRK